MDYCNVFQFTTIFISSGDFNMTNKDYKTVQIPKESHDLLRQYCDENGLKMGKFLEIMIGQYCKVKKPDPKKVLLVDGQNGKTV